MRYYIFVENGKINGCGQCECLNEDIYNCEVEQEIYNDFVSDNLKYIAVEKEVEVEVPDFETTIEEYEDENGETQTREIQVQTGTHTETQTAYEIVPNPNYEQEKAEKEQELINNLKMTALDFIGVLQTFGLTLEQISTYLENNLAVKMQLTYCNNVYCGVAKSLMPVTFENITITADMIERAFRTKYGE